MWDSCYRLSLLYFFVRRDMDEPIWKEQLGWMKCADIQAVEKALEGLLPYIMTPHLKRDFYGAKAENVKKQFQTFVPAQFVPDEFPLSAVGEAEGMGKKHMQAPITCFISTDLSSDPTGPSTIDTSSIEEGERTEDVGRSRNSLPKPVVLVPLDEKQVVTIMFRS